MPKVEIEEADFLANQQLAKTIQSMMGNPEARKKLLEAQKIVNPQVVTPKDYQDEVLSEIAKEREARLALEKKIEDEKKAAETEAKTREFLSSWESAKARLRDKYPDLNDKGIEEIENLAKTRGIPDLEAAGALFRELHPPATPEHPSGPSGFNLFDTPQQDDLKDDMKKLMESGGENQAVLDKMIRDTLGQIRSQRRAA
jgi:hypothetical protein